MTQKGRFKLTALVLAVLGIAVGLFVAVRGPKLVTTPQRMPDGTLLKLRQVDFGGSVIVGDSMFGRLRREFLFPAGVSFLGRQLLSPPIRIITNYWKQNNFELSFYLQLSPGPVKTDLYDGKTRVVMFNEKGDENENFMYDPFTLETSTNGITQVLNVPVFPRNGKTVGLRVLTWGLNGWEKAAEFIIKNPVPGPHPVLSAQPLPVTKRMGDLALTLEEFKIGDWPTNSPHIFGVLNAHAEFQVTANGLKSDAWRPYEVVGFEGDGNRFDCAVLWFDTNTGSSISFDWPQSQSEVWKLRLEFARRKDFLEGDLWRLTNVPFSGSSPPQSRYSKILHGTEVTVTLNGRASLKVEPNRNPGDIFVSLVNAVDDQGRNVLAADTYDGASRGSISAKLRIPPDAKSLNVTLAVQKGIFVEFTAKPTLESVTNEISGLPQVR